MRVLMPLPDRDFDVTEVAVPWSILTGAGHQVTFATERAGTVPAADPRLLTGVLFGRLGAAEEPRRLYRELTATPEFTATAAWAELNPAEYDGLLLPGGHAPGMRQYLGSPVLQAKVAEFWRLDRPVGAICHGVLVLARARDPETGRSVLHGRRTTCLPKYLERSAFALTSWRLGRYFRTYPQYVEDEVRTVLDRPEDFVRGPRTLAARGTATEDRPAFVVEDGRYISARWPGDAYLFGRQFLAALERGRAARGAPANPDDWDARYADPAPPPWDIGHAQPGFVRLAEAGRLTGRVLDIGCGTGEHTLLAAAQGADAVGLDLSGKAIELARRKAADRGRAARFAVADALALPGPAAAGPLGELVGGGFDTVLDSGVFHVFDDADRTRYVASLAAVTRPGGTCYLMCFSERQGGDWGPRRVREDEIRAAFADGWTVLDVVPERFELAPGMMAPHAEAWLATIRRDAP